jgi:hypothetical protein
LASRLSDAPHRHASLNELEGERHGFGDRHLGVVALPFGQVEREIDRMPDVARRQTVERDTGDVGERIVAIREHGVLRGAILHRCVDGLLVVVVDRMEVHGVNGAARRTGRRIVLPVCRQAVSSVAG